MQELLALQALDTEADQLRHRLATLPERAEVDAAKLVEAQAADSLAKIDEQRHALGREVKRFQDETASITSHMEEVEATLYGGTVRSPKELTDLQSELNSLKRHRRDVEDQELDVMEQLEPLDAEREKAKAAQVEAAERRENATARLDAASEVLNGELEGLSARRAELVAHVDASALSDYERLRAQFGGVAVAQLSGGRCSGCHLSLPAVDLDQIKRAPADAQVSCPECGRLLAR
ncbi:MAG: C4-type zinc ribbon domain-containing protein [Microthrixaceae bacterium]|nr:C4-type zinc ribbon domain-containing protein [Microthrixaceae bacterium]